MRGSIEVITGPMFAGKSTELMRRVRRYEHAGRMWRVLKPKIDTRGEGLLTHDRVEMPADAIESLWAAQWYIEETGTEVIAIDEVHFLPMGKHEIEAITMAAIEGANFIFAGLDTDQEGQPFYTVAGLMAIATDIVKLTAVCSSCGEFDAVRSQWVSELPYNDKNRVGAGEKYAPRCISCFQPVTTREEPTHDIAATHR